MIKIHQNIRLDLFFLEQLLLKISSKYKTYISHLKFSKYIFFEELLYFCCCYGYQIYFHLNIYKNFDNNVNIVCSKFGSFNLSSFYTVSQNTFVLSINQFQFKIPHIETTLILVEIHQLLNN